MTLTTTFQPGRTTRRTAGAGRDPSHRSRPWQSWLRCSGVRGGGQEQAACEQAVLVLVWARGGGGCA